MFWVVPGNIFIDQVQSRKHTVKMYMNKGATNNIGVLFCWG